MRITGLLLWMACLSTAQGAGYAGETFRVTGTWSGQAITSQRLQLREPEADPSKGQISGHIQSLDVAQRRFAIGPMQVRWREATTFRDIAAEKLAIGLTVRVSGRMENNELVASTIQPSTAMPAGTVQLTGKVTATQDAAGNEKDLRILGQAVTITQSGYNRLDSLTQRQDSRRPEQPFGFDLFGRRATITGEYDLSFRDRDNLRLDGRSHVLDLDHELKLEFFYPLSDSAWIFLSGKGVYEGEIYRAGGDTTSTRYVARDQTWIYLDRVGGTDFSLQAGRINLAESREWWWDDDLDGIRIMHDRGPWHSEFTLAREMLRERSSDRDIDPESDGITRWLGRTSWLWASKQTLDIFALHARDHSTSPGVGETLLEADEDESDARMTWLGLRALGDRGLGNYGDLRYWVDAAWMRGREVLIDYDSDDGISTVDDIARRKVRGAAYDVGLSWETRLPARPSLTLGHAWSSGDGNTGDSVDHAFRQTGLHNNKWRYHGVNRFRYYGELMRPELSNLAISTVGLGLSLGNARSVDLVYHRYRQDKAARSMRDARVSASLNGQSTDIGEELDLVLGSREWSRVDLALSGSMFRAGNAFGSKAGERAYQVLLEITVNF